MTTKLKWYMLTLVGKDRPGIVAHVTAALYEGGANLGETSMMRLGGNFTIMLMVSGDSSEPAVQEVYLPRPSSSVRLSGALTARWHITYSPRQLQLPGLTPQWDLVPFSQQPPMLR